jgi:hypothetical protein
MTLMSYPLANELTIYRYVFPVLFGIAAAMVLVLVVRGRGWAERWTGLAALGLIAAVHTVPGVEWLVARARMWNEEGRSAMEAVLQSQGAYTKAQEAVPAHATIFSATSFPVLLDQARNPVFIADVPGAASPPPGMPIFDGAAGISRYLREQGIDYVIYTLPEMDRTIYSMGYWSAAYEHPESVDPDTARCARFNYSFLKAMEEMPGQGEVLYRSRTLCVVRLK